MLSRRSIIPAGLVLTLAVPGAAAAAVGPGQDLRSPDTRDAAAEAAAASPPGQDLRSPDARYAAAYEAGSRAAPDLRSPDTRDLATSGGSVRPTAAPARFVQSSPRSFDWGDAGIGAGGALGLVLVVGAAGVAVTRRRARQPHAELVS